MWCHLENRGVLKPFLKKKYLNRLKVITLWYWKGKDVFVLDELMLCYPYQVSWMVLICTWFLLETGASLEREMLYEICMWLLGFLCQLSRCHRVYGGAAGEDIHFERFVSLSEDYSIYSYEWRFYVTFSLVCLDDPAVEHEVIFCSCLCSLYPSDLKLMMERFRKDGSVGRKRNIC